MIIPLLSVQVAQHAIMVWCSLNSLPYHMPMQSLCGICPALASILFYLFFLPAIFTKAAPQTDIHPSPPFPPSIHFYWCLFLCSHIFSWCGLLKYCLDSLCVRIVYYVHTQKKIAYFRHKTVFPVLNLLAQGLTAYLVVTIELVPWASFLSFFLLPF